MARNDRPASSSPEPAEFRWGSRLPWWVPILAIVSTILFFPGQWLGEGLIGGDIYTYSLPQKVYLAETLKQGEWPLWNPLVGLGYPVLAESQTGAIYPLHLLYAFLSVTAANDAVLLIHYVLAFAGMFWCARWFGRGAVGALLAATVYVYGWFPARLSLDWAILGGLYLPLVIGCAEAFWQTRRPAYALGFALSIGLQLLGGHYHLAFLTWLLLGACMVWRIIGSLPNRHSPTQPTTIERTTIGDRTTGDSTENLSATLSVLGVSFLLGVGLAAVQMCPTWELKTRSQRADVGGREFDPAYGHLPPIYLSQVALPWVWYDPALDLDTALGKLTYLSIPAATNRVEAHLYFGQIPLYLALWTVIRSWRGRVRDTQWILWSAVIVGSLLYATGWLLPVLKYVPGFNFFRGPGRGGLLTTFAVAQLAGMACDHLGAVCSARWWGRLAVALWLLTFVDLWYWPRTVAHAVSIPHPPIADREASPVRRLLLREPAQPRLFAPGPNLPTLLGVSALPVYLGLGPEEYFADPLPPVELDDFHGYSVDREKWLRARGVTHILSFEPLEPRGWPVDLIWSGMDPLLNRAWARFDEPIFLYRLRGAAGRLVWESPVEGASAKIEHFGTNEVRMTADSLSGGRLVLKDLNYPGWQVTVDGKPVTDSPVSGPYRSVDLTPGRHLVVWSYRPLSVYCGGGITGIAVLGLGLGLMTLSRRRDRIPDASH